MADYGVTINGFNRKTFDIIKSEIETDLKNEVAQNVDLSEDSILSIMTGIVASYADESWGNAEDCYNSNDRNKAEGVSLENAISLVGIRKKGASASTAAVSFRGDNLSIIPAFTQLKQQSTNLIFQNAIASKIDSSFCNWIRLKINSLIPTTPYRLFIDGNVYTFTTDSDPTNAEIILGLKTIIESADLGLTITDEGSGNMVVEAVDKNDIYDITGSSLFTTLKVQSLIDVVCTVVGVNQVPIGSINQISTSVPGLDSVFNYDAGQAGRLIENDQEARFRTQADIAVSGFNFTDAIKAKVMNDVAGISYCRVYENETLVDPDANGIAAKSWEAIIEGGSNTDIANELYKMKIGGMRSSGNISIPVIDGDGIPHNIRFSRPTNLYFWLRVTIDSYNPEEQFPTNGDAAIKQAILEYSKNFNIGDVIVVQKFNSPIFSVAGLGSVTIEIAATSNPDGSPVYGTTNINCSIRQKPNFDLTRLSVIT